MAHPAGEILRCDECGAEIVYTKACNCPEGEPKAHYDVCCNKDMRSLGVKSDQSNRSQQVKAAG